MMDHRNVVDGKTYRQFRGEWRAVYKHLVNMIQREKFIRVAYAQDMGQAARKVHVVSSRRPNTDERLKRLERFRKNLGQSQIGWRVQNGICLQLRAEARAMMAMLEDVKARRPERASK